MNQPSAGFWSELVEMNRRVDSLVERVMRAVQPPKPIGREVPFFASIETRFENLPEKFSSVCSPNSDVVAGNNVKHGVFTNGGSRVYVRELGFQPFFGRTPTLTTSDYEARLVGGGGALGFTNIRMFNWRWNFQTSIQQRWYADSRVLARAGGRFQAGNHLAFREPLVIEPMETLTFECELLSFGMNTGLGTGPTTAGVSMIMSGYREGV